MRKSYSLQMLDVLGFNTIDYFITANFAEAAQYLNRYYEAPRSMRTEKGGDFHCPFYYNLPGKILLEKAKLHIENGYTLIFSPSLDAKDCTAYGTLAFTNGPMDIMEFVIGPGLLRDLDTNPNKQILEIKQGTTGFKTIGTGIAQGSWYMLHELYKLAKLLGQDQAPCIFEWSHYPYRVGKMQKHFIFWELREY